MIKTQVCIIGAGAGGIGCAYRLIKKGVRVVLVDKKPSYGGSMVFSGVDGWEPGVSFDGIHSLIKDELEKIPFACHVTEVVPNMNLFDPTVGRDWSRHSFQERPWGYCMPMGDTYASTLGRCISVRGENGAMKRFQFDNVYFNTVIHNIFDPFSSYLTELFGYQYQSCNKENGKIVSVNITNGDIIEEIFADYFVDSSGDIVLARDAGCEYAIGTEGREDYGEPSADVQSDDVNGVTYVFRVSKTEDPFHIDPLPDVVMSSDIEQWKETQMRECISFAVQYPNQDISFNMLPTMQGAEYFQLGENADKTGKARVYAYWHYLQSEKNIRGYTLKQIFDAGIRESYRLKGKYILREQDIRAGAPLDTSLSGRIVAIADHALDIHGKNGMGKELKEPYLIPLECAIPNEYSNLFVACRGASFTHIAASSVRLSRTMLSFGEGVGEYVAELSEKSRGNADARLTLHENYE